MPQWGAYEAKDKAKAAGKNTLNKATYPLKKFSGRKIGAYYKYLVFHGDPALSVALICGQNGQPNPSILRTGNLFDKHDLLTGGKALREALPIKFRDALTRETSKQRAPIREITPDLNFLAMDIRRIGTHTFNCRFMFKVDKPLEKDWRFYFHGGVSAEHVNKIPKMFRKGKTQMWNFAPEPPTSQWKAGQTVVLSTQISAADIPYDIRCGFFIENAYHGSSIRLGMTDFSSIGK